MQQAPMSNSVMVLLTIGGVAADGHCMEVEAQGGQVRAELAKGELCSPQARWAGLCCLQGHFQSVQSPRWNADPLGVLLAGSCWRCWCWPGCLRVTAGSCQPPLGASHIPGHGLCEPLSSVDSGLFPALWMPGCPQAANLSHCSPSTRKGQSLSWGLRLGQQAGGMRGLP